MQTITLSENHRRSVSSSIYLVEKMVLEIEKELTTHADSVMLKIQTDKSPDEIQRMLDVLHQIKQYVQYLSVKYNLKVKEQNIDNIIRAYKAKMWEVLCDSTSHGLRGFGHFPHEFAAEFDADLGKLQEMIKTL